jgi:hypothetical protein
LFVLVCFVFKILKAECNFVFSTVTWIWHAMLFRTLQQLAYHSETNTCQRKFQEAQTLIQ